MYATFSEDWQLSDCVLNTLEVNRQRVYDRGVDRRRSLTSWQTIKQRTSIIIIHVNLAVHLAATEVKRSAIRGLSLT